MIVDLFLVYQFIRRLATPFEKWPAFEHGIIDKDGNILRKRKDLTKVKERDAWGKFDVMILKLKRLLEKVPGGKSKLATFAAALWLLKEQNHVDADTLTEEHIEEKFNEYFALVCENRDLDIDSLFEEAMNSAGSGAIAGIGVGKDGEPGLTPAQMRKHKKKTPLKRFSQTVGN
jgi:hypothetical protein